MDSNYFCHVLASYYTTSYLVLIIIKLCSEIYDLGALLNPLVSRHLHWNCTHYCAFKQGTIGVLHVLAAGADAIIPVSLKNVPVKIRSDPELEE